MSYDRPKISVITPSFNQGKYIETCLKSVLGQNYPNLEFILIDGGSTDESLSVILRYTPHFSYWVSEPDRGQSDAINKGFQRATGDLVAWLNTDDYYLPGALNAVADAYIKQPGAPFYFGDGWRVDESGQPITAFVPADPILFNRPALVYGLNYILQPAAFIHRPSLLQAGLLDTNLHYGMDSDLWLRLSALGEPVSLPVKLAASREYETTKTATGSFKRLEELRQIAEKHAGLPVTPGYLCYYLDTLDRYVRQHPEQYPPEYVQAVGALWGATSQLLERYGAHPDGYPFLAQPPGPAESVSLAASPRPQPRWRRAARAIWRRLRRFYENRG